MKKVKKVIPVKKEYFSSDELSNKDKLQILWDELCELRGDLNDNFPPITLKSGYFIKNSLEFILREFTFIEMDGCIDVDRIERLYSILFEVWIKLKGLKKVTSDSLSSNGNNLT